MLRRIVYGFISICMMACVSNDRYERYNIDPNNPSSIDPGFLFNSALKTLVDTQTDPNIFVNINRLFAQYWATTTYPDESNYNVLLSNTNGTYWNFLYVNVLQDLHNAKEIVSSDSLLSETQKSTHIAQIEVLMIYTWQLLVDTYGNIPYSQALDLDSYPLPTYDDAFSIYEDLILRIDTAITNLSDSGFEIDNLYYGDISAWQTFAISLKLRLGIRLADYDSNLSRQIVESAYNAGVFSSNADNAILFYPGGENPNPIWTDIIQTGRQDFVGSNTIIDIMNGLNDPRRYIYFQENLGPDTFEGGIYGDINTYDFYSHLGFVLLEPDYPALLMDFTEVSFYLAEAAERGYSVGADAETHYNNGIIASFEFWGVPDVMTYLNNPDVNYMTAPGAWQNKIGTQFWLAMYNRGYEGWTAWRTYDSPQLNLPVLTENPVPLRHQYPINEQNLNVSNWEEASQSIGGDQQSSRIFWDID